ncbi:MAG TPA: cell division protein ZapD [Gammaproteobacteria bacterium]|nr:cell division protein ZapD [Gammaproteobacteria bacterium]
MANVIYEQPLSEAIRLCLRLEKLFHQLDDALHGSKGMFSHFAMDALMEILRVSDRPDLKSKMAQALTSQITKFNQWLKNPQVDSSKLKNLITDLEEYVSILNDRHAKVGSELREHPFLQAISHHVVAPGGVCNHNVPMYQLWLEQPYEVKASCFEEWLVSVDLLKKIVVTLLKIVRNSYSFEKNIAKEGFFQIALNQAPSYSLIRVAVKPEHNYYAMISVGKHRLSVTFYSIDFDQSCSNLDRSYNDIEFYLATCC